MNLAGVAGLSTERDTTSCAYTQSLIVYISSHTENKITADAMSQRPGSVMDGTEPMHVVTCTSLRIFVPWSYTSHIN
jgi:hypothetical protein